MKLNIAVRFDNYNKRRNDATVNGSQELIRGLRNHDILP